MKGKNYISILSIFLLLLFSCKKDSEPEEVCTHDESFEAMLEWCYFKEGTWWIYEEETSFELDSVYVTESIINFDIEAFEYTTYSVYEDFNNTYWNNPSSTGNSNVSECVSRRLFRDKWKPGDFIGQGIIANFPPIEGDFSGGGGIPDVDTVLTVAIDSIITLNQFTFENAAFFTSQFQPSENYRPLGVFLVKNIGIVRKELPDSEQIWNLVEYNIVQ